MLVSFQVSKKSFKKPNLAYQVNDLDPPLVNTA